METKLDQDLHHTAKDHAKDIDTIEENTDDNGEEEDKLRDEKDLGLSNVQSFENAVELTYIQWKKIDATDHLNFFVLSHMLQFLRVADDQNTSVSEVLYNMNLVKADISIFQRLGIRSNISNNTMDLWKGVQKFALNEDQDNTDETGEEQDHFHLNSLSSKIDALSGNLEPVLDNILLLDETPDGFPLGPTMLNADCKTVCDHIYDRLPLNNLQRLVVEEIINHIIKNKSRMHLDIEKQLLLYMQEKGGVGKSRVVKALEMGFAFLDRRKKLVISAPTRCAAEGIRGSTMYTALEVNTCRGRNFVAKKNARWSQRSSLMIDEVSIIDLKLLTIIDKQLRKAKGSDTSSMTFFRGLLLVVLMGDFYQFAPVTRKALWDEPHGEDEVHRKTL